MAKSFPLSVIVFVTSFLDPLVLFSMFYLSTFFPLFDVVAFNGGLVTLCMEREDGVIWGPHYVVQLPSRKHIVNYEAICKGALASTWLDISKELLFT